jgi:excinuclease ABC subunit B
MYADRITDSMRRCIDETERRRKIQAAHNKKHKITPKSVKRAILDMRGSEYDGVVDLTAMPRAAEKQKKYVADVPLDKIPQTVDKLRKEMHGAAEDLDFEKAAQLRDRIKALEAIELSMRGD